MKQAMAIGSALFLCLCVGAPAFAAGPLLYLGVRVEDTIVITETGCENLTPGLARTVAEIEAFMKK